MLSKAQNSAVKKVAKDHGFGDFSVSIQSGSKKGDNYLGNIFSITVKDKDGTKEKSLILKCALDNEKVRAQMPIGDCYKREVYLYKTVLPAFEKLQEKYPVPNHFEATAKMYDFSLTEGQEWLLLENITTCGFRMLNRKETMNGEHVSMVIKELGKLHSLSFVMKQLEPGQYRELKSNLKDYFKDYPHIVKSWAEGMQRTFQDAYKAVQDNDVAIERLKKCEKLLTILMEEKDDEENMVILHGDAWCNNMMFKYADTDNPSKPTELCLLDWQISKVGIPVVDLCYFLFLSASKEVLDNHKTYLEQYYQVLEENLSALGLDVRSLYPRVVLEDQWKKHCMVGLYIATSMMNNLVQDEADATTLSDMADKEEDILKAFSDHGGLQSEESYSRLRDIILMLVKNNYL